MIYDSFSKEEKDRYYKDIFFHEAELFDFFANRIYNIPLWIKCAQTMIGLFFQEEEQIRKGLYSRFGVLDQLKRGVTKEGCGMKPPCTTISMPCSLCATCSI